MKTPKTISISSIVHCLLLAGAWTTAGSARAATPPVVLLNDNFNAATANTFDLNVDIARQTGTLAPIQYTLAFGAGHFGHQLQNVNAPDQLLLAEFPNSTSSLNFNFNGNNSAGGLQISFDLDSVPTVYGGDPGNWGCVNLGAAQADQLVNVNGGQTHFGILFRASGTIQAFDGASVVTPVEPLYSTRPPGSTNHIDLVITDADGNPFDGLGSTIIEVFVNGGGLPVYSFTKPGGGYANNYINLQGSFRAHFDNLVITRLSADAAPVIANPSFEADTFTVFPGYVGGNGPITGWNALNNHGVNPGTFGGPFTDNGTIPDGTKAAFLQDDGPMQGVISGLSIGATYQVRYFENSRTCCSGTAPFCEVKVGGNTVVAAHAVPPVGGSNPYREGISDPFTATATAMPLEFIKSNPQGGDTTLLIDNVSLLAPNTPPSITAEPQDQTVGLGDTAAFSVSAVGSAPLSFQWYFGADPVGGNSATLSVLADFPDVAGNYYVVVANSTGSVTSRVAQLVVRARVPGLFDTGVDDNGAALADGAVDPHYQIIVNADNPSTDAFVENSAAFPIVAGPWVANTATSKWIGPRFDTAGAAGLAQGGGVYLYRLTFDLSGVDVSSVVITGGWAVDNEGLSIRVNGVATGLINGGGFGGLTPFAINGANATFVDGLNTLDFEVRNVDVVAGYTGLRVVGLRGLAELPGTPPSITTQPQSQLAGIGETVTFTVVATGSSPLHYHWQKGGAALAAPDSATLTLDNVSFAGGGAYSVIVSNEFGVATSADATLTVLDVVPGAFNTGVDDSKAALPDNSVDPHYKLIVNADSSSPDALVEDSTLFPIVTGPWVANNAGSKWIGPRLETSAAAGGAGDAGNYVYRTTVDVAGFDPASIVITGVWATDNEGIDILVNGQSTGHANSAQFVVFTPFTLSNHFVHGVNTIDFKLNNSAVGYTGLRVDRLRALGTTLPPNTPPFIVTQPESQVPAFGDLVMLRATANGSAPLRFQWFFGPDPLPGETNATLFVQFDFPDQIGDYSVEIRNDAGVVRSAPARLGPPNQPPGFAIGPDITADAGSTVQMANWATAIQPGSPDEAGQVLSFEVTLAPSGILFTEPPTIDPNGTLRFRLSPATPAGSQLCTVILRDNGGTAGDGRDTSDPQTFLIQVFRRNSPPTAVANVASVCDAAGSVSNLTLISANGSNACVVFDGMLSLDPDGDLLTFAWFVDGAVTPAATGVRATNCLEVGQHTVMLVVDDGTASDAASVSVEVVTACDAVENLLQQVNSADLKRKTKRPLISALKHVCATFERRKFKSGVHKLEEFQHKLRGHARRESPAVADELSRAAQEILDAIFCAGEPSDRDPSHSHSQPTDRP